MTKKPSAKRKRITLALLEKHNACTGGVDWFKAQKKTELRDVVTALIDDRRANWANWLLVRMMTLRQKRQYAIFAAEQVIDIFEKKYPNDKRPREAIEAAKRVLKSPTAANKEKARAAADAAAADAAYAAAAAAAADAAYAAAAAAAAAAYAAYAAAAAAARRQTQRTIAAYGVRLVYGKPARKKTK